MIRALLLVLLAPGLAMAEPNHKAIGTRSLQMLEASSVAFAATTEQLRISAPSRCAEIDEEALHTHFNLAWDAWMGLSQMRFGPLEEEDRALQIAFWPDSRGSPGAPSPGSRKPRIR